MSLADVASDARGASSAHTGVPIDVPYNDLSPRQTADGAVRHGRRVDRRVLRGRSSAVSARSVAGSRRLGTRLARLLFRFQFKGLYPALEEASKLSPRLRGLLEQFVDEIDCSECGGSRLRDDAAAVRSATARSTRSAARRSAICSRK